MRAAERDRSVPTTRPARASTCAARALSSPAAVGSRTAVAAATAAPSAPISGGSASRGGRGSRWSRVDSATSSALEKPPSARAALAAAASPASTARAARTRLARRSPPFASASSHASEAPRPSTVVAASADASHTAPSASSGIARSEARRSAAATISPAESDCRTARMASVTPSGEPGAPSEPTAAPRRRRADVTAAAMGPASGRAMSFVSASTSFCARPNAACPTSPRMSPVAATSAFLRHGAVGIAGEAKRVRRHERCVPLRRRPRSAGLLGRERGRFVRRGVERSGPLIERPRLTVREEQLRVEIARAGGQRVGALAVPEGGPDLAQGEEHPRLRARLRGARLRLEPGCLLLEEGRDLRSDLLRARHRDLARDGAVAAEPAERRQGAERPRRHARPRHVGAARRLRELALRGLHRRRGVRGDLDRGGRHRRRGRRRGPCVRAATAPRGLFRELGLVELDLAGRHGSALVLQVDRHATAVQRDGPLPASLRRRAAARLRLLAPRWGSASESLPRTGPPARLPESERADGPSRRPSAPTRPGRSPSPCRRSGSRSWVGHDPPSSPSVRRTSR